MPISEAPYKRTYKHGISRGRETTVTCDGCGGQVPKYKTFTVRRGMRINDPMILQQVDKRMIHMMSKIMRYCPACARFRHIVQPGKAVRKKGFSQSQRVASGR
ncbi:MAG: hypothetical protein QW818_03165 [Candidatus Aenigmatarchaeota archaeon]|nr:hypothetical protein [Candidatus Aenigmarchaeota archaeon]